MTKTNINYDAETSKKRKFNILIIDDDDNVALLFKDYLESRGHLVSVTDEGTRGLVKSNNNNFDLIFMDYHLNKDGSPIINNQCKNNPKSNSAIDGTVITECIKNSNNKSLIFAYTGDNSKTAINKFKKVGMSGAIFKPVDVIILNKLMHLLETKSGTNYQHSNQILQNFSKHHVQNSVILF